jgi:hypothetical protein
MAYEAPSALCSVEHIPDGEHGHIAGSHAETDLSCAAVLAGFPALEHDENHQFHHRFAYDTPLKHIRSESCFTAHENLCLDNFLFTSAAFRAKSRLLSVSITFIHHLFHRLHDIGHTIPLVLFYKLIPEEALCKGG